MIHAWNEAQKRATDFYEYNQLVFLKRDPSQFGRIGCGGYGDRYDLETRTQLVFWEHEGGDIVTSESVDDLIGEEELHERRIIFIQIMRRPEMRVLRLALRHLDWDKGIDWHMIREIETVFYAPGCWMMNTDIIQVVSLNVSPEMTYEDFHTQSYEKERTVFTVE